MALAAMAAFHAEECCYLACALYKFIIYITLQ